MFGYGYYGNGGGSSSSLSGLSPLAPPFTVDRSLLKINSNPLVDFTQPPYTVSVDSSMPNWLPSSHYPPCGSNLFDGIHSSDGYNYMGPESVSLPSTHLPGVNRVVGGPTDGMLTSLVETQPYFPSYVLPAIHDDSPLVVPSQHGYDLLPTSQVSTLKDSYHNDYTQNIIGSDYTLRWDGLWNGLDDWEHGKQQKLNGFSKAMNPAGSSVHKNYANQGAYTYSGLNTCKGAPPSIDIPGRDEHSGCASTEQLDDKSKYVPVDCSRTSTMGSKLPEIYTVASSPKLFTNSTNYQVPYSSSHKDTSVQEDMSLDESAPATKFSPASVIRLPAGTSSSLMNTDAMKMVNIGNDMDLDFAGNNLSSAKESCPLSGDRICFDATQLSKLLDGNPQIITQSPSNEELSENKTVTNNALDHIFIKKFEGNFASIPDTYSVVLGGHEASSSSEIFTDNHYNPSVDSPCWRGASLSYFSPCDVSGDVTPRVMKNLEPCNGLNLQGTQIFPLITDECTLPNKSIGNSEIIQNRLEDGKFISEKKGAPGTGIVVTNMDDKYASEDVSSNVSSVNGQTKLSISPGGEFTPQMDVQTMVKTMHNLSELLLFNCSNELCELKEEDRVVLKNLINNLETCISKKVEQKPQIQESKFSHGGTSIFLGDVAELHKGSSVDKSHISKVAAANVQDELDHPHLRNENTCHTVSGKKVENFSDFVSENTDVSILKDDKLTQALKKVLSDNFCEEEETLPQTLLYKNLWLEAEAALCSMNYRNRFNRLKIEMENCKSLEGKETARDVEKLSSSKVSADVNTADNVAPEAKDMPTKDISVQNSPLISTSFHADDAMARFNILKDRDANSNSMNLMDASSEVSSDSSNVEEFETEAKNSPVPDISINDHLISSTTSNADNLENSVMARFRILKSRVENSRSTELEGQLTDSWPVTRDNSEDTSLDVNIEPHHNANYFANSPTVKEFHLCVKDDPVIQSRRTDMPGNHQLPGGWYDCSSSDWEHVLKEELSG